MTSELEMERTYSYSSRPHEAAQYRPVDDYDTIRYDDIYVRPKANLAS